MSEKETKMSDGSTYNLTEGNCKGLGKAMPESAPLNSIMKDGHKLQHVEYNGVPTINEGFK